MVATDKVFAESIPRFYDRFLVPLIFEPYALDLANRIAAARPRDVLETAAGTGVLTRAMVSRLPDGVRLTVTDLNQPMLDHAATLQPQDRPVSWRQADALALPFFDQSFDAVACQFGAMFFPDKVKGYREARRVLRPGGRFCFSVWDQISTNEFADVVTESLIAVFPQDPPRFLARTPHGYHDTDLIRRQVAEAGFSDIAIDAVEHRSRAPTPRHPAVAYCQGTPLRNEIEARGVPLDEATAIAAAEIARRFGSGAVDGAIQAHVISVQT